MASAAKAQYTQETGPTLSHVPQHTSQPALPHTGLDVVVLLFTAAIFTLMGIWFRGVGR